jgi:hypothetical protein
VVFIRTHGIFGEQSGDQAGAVPVRAARVTADAGTAAFTVGGVEHQFDVTFTPPDDAEGSSAVQFGTCTGPGGASVRFRVWR